MKPPKSNTDQRAKLFKAILALRNPQEAHAFFEDLCTPAELQALSERWRVVTLVKAGLSYRQIHEMTGVSVTTIGRVARALTYGTGGYNLIFERVKTDDNETS